ncbi:MAG: hypothetical protein D6762_05695 [Candidatus Neomarinimicrobiota bacterium]|nr:MAG: hypothetical protein D6762_05695 [Candidatus Neomarinimicrobiota bacterium]
MRVFPKIHHLIPVVLAGTMLWAQDASYLNQKLMVENDLRTRISTALSKIMPPSQFVVHVSVDLELSDALEEQVTFAGDTEESAPVSRPAAKTEAAPPSAEGTSSKEKESGYVGGLPIPGFEFEVQPEVTEETEAAPEPETVPEEWVEEPVAVEKKEKILSRTTSKRRPAIARVVRKNVKVIVQEDTPPAMLENVRTIVMATAELDLQAGDSFLLTTASFKEQREEKKAEKVLLQSINKKIASLEEQQEQERAQREENWKQELERYRQEEAKRSEADREYFKQQLAKLEAAARERAFQEEKRRILLQDSLKIKQLDNQIQLLKAQLSSTQPDSQKAQAETRLTRAQQEREQLNQQLDQKLAELAKVQEDIAQARREGKSTPMTIILIAILGSLLLVLLIILIFVLMNRSRQPVYPPMMMPPPPRRRKKKRKPAPKPEEPAPAQPTAPPPPSPETPAPPKSVEEDPGVIASELGDMRQAVVSMSVGQPQTATRIVKEWMQQEAPPPPPEPETPAPEAPPEEESGKKKRKK